jgi:hypothetical protein
MSKPEFKSKYEPQPKQAMLHKCAANEVLYGGAAGPGKSHALRQEALYWATRIDGLQVYLFRRTYPELEKNHILPSLHEYPLGYARYRDQKRRWEFPNGSIIHMSHAQHEKDIFNYQGAEIHLLLIDELTTFTEFMYDYVRARVRCTLEIPEKWQHRLPGILCASNPGGVGHEFVKRRWVDFVKPYKYKRAVPREGGMMRCFIPGLLQDNEILMRTDPEYVHRLDALPEPFRTAYKDGDWDIFMGQAFHFSRDHHVTPQLPIPENAQVYHTFDWGFGAPYSNGWWWADADGRLYRFGELYGWNGLPNEGIRHTDSEIAESIINREVALGLRNEGDTWLSRTPRRKVLRIAGHDCWNKKPDYKGGGQGVSTMEVFSKYHLYFSKGDASRELKIRQFHERLRIHDVAPPMVQIYSTCTQFIRTIPLLQTDPGNVEDVDTTMEDHIYDEACHIFMARPLTPKLRPLKKSSYQKRIENLYKPKTDDFLKDVLFEHERTIDIIQGGSRGFEAEEYDDGMLSSTVGD